MNNFNIAITGDLGSGKSTVSKELCKKLNFEYFSTGLIQRKLALERGMNTLELNYHSDKDKSIDEYIDNQLKEIDRTKTKLLLDSRMAWFFVKNSFKIYLTIQPEVAAKRVMSDNKRINEPNGINIEEKTRNLIERRKVEDIRFEKVYGVRCWDLGNYDLIIDTSNLTISQIIKIILNKLVEWKQKRPFNRFWASPKSLFPTQPIRELACETAKQLSVIIKKEKFKEEFPIEVIKYKSYLFIWDGHKRTSAALLSKIPYIPLLILAQDDELIHSGDDVKTFVEASYNLSWMYDWEDMHGFNFGSYPLIKQKV